MLPLFSSTLASLLAHLLLVSICDINLISHHADIQFPIVAGHTVVKTVDRPEDPNNTWSGEVSSIFELRIGPDYESNKKKAPAGPPLFELMGMDLFSSDAKVDHIASKLKFPPGKFLRYFEFDVTRDYLSHVPILTLPWTQY